MVQLLNQEQVLQFIVDKFIPQQNKSAETTRPNNYTIADPRIWIQQRWGKSEG